VLTKPLGTGVVTTAIKRGLAPEPVVTAAVASMTLLNAAAAAAAAAAGATGATDVTGFSLLGHLGRMALESHVDVTIDVDAVPVLPGVTDLVAAGAVPGGTGRNLTWVGDRLERGSVGDRVLSVLADPQTSGGLVFGAAPDEARAAAERLGAEGHTAAVIGTATAGSGRIHLR
jgi:selenide,water dikinase